MNRNAKTASRATSRAASSKPRANDTGDKPARAKKRTAAKRAAPAAKKTHEFVAGKGFLSLTDAAKEIAKTPKVRATAKKEKPAPKRVETPANVIESASKHFAKLADAMRKGEMSKVGLVRDMALWQGKKLQRRDVFAIVKTQPKLEIADATISTQFQLARSGKLETAA